MYEPQKSLGQNFLSDHQIVNSMISALDIQPGDDIVEIGPGLGVLTEAMAQRMGFMSFTLKAIEIDERFVPKLEGMFAFYPAIKIIEADVLQWLPQFESTAITKVIGSLPFYITSPIIHSIIKMKKQPQIAVLMTQKEVADKIVADAPDSSYMSVFVKTFFDVEYLLTVPRQKFNPAPNVDGGVLVLKNKGLNLSQDEIRRYEGFLHKGFGSPRKMLNKRYTTDELARGKVDPTLRAEALTAEQWYEFYKKLNN
jgi:16S rRNA (adenine1518-N6/adenine1519-N6)-dimethyltransferase